ncbi:MAG TPA: carboxymuconolactone decarboxylase family protein [Dehalococcoidia bacterium]|nr:carboxymuconolactone decarboxylase family protein [Dehalococcoidia bacterium]
MARVPKPKREDLPTGAEKAWALSANADGSLRGPHNALLHVPPISERVAELGDHLRNHGALSGAERELAIIATSREGEARFAWQAHEAAGRHEGVRPEAIEAVRNLAPIDAMKPRERIIVEVARSLAREHGLSDDLFRRAQAEFGTELLVELVALCGYYRLVGYVLNAFKVDLPENATPTF